MVRWKNIFREYKLTDKEVRMFAKADTQKQLEWDSGAEFDDDRLGEPLYVIWWLDQVGISQKNFMPIFRQTTHIKSILTGAK